MIYSRITGTGSYLPPTRRHQRRSRRSGVDTTRRMDPRAHRHPAAPHRRRRRRRPATSRWKPSRRALEAAGMTAGDIDLIIVATSTPDIIFPSTACLLQAQARRERLRGLRRAGGVQRLRLCAGDRPTSSSAPARTSSALVVGAEVFSRILDWNDRGTCVLFGDGAGAVVLAAARASPACCHGAARRRQPWRASCRVPGNVSGGKIVGPPFLQMEGKAGVQVGGAGAGRSGARSARGGRHDSSRTSTG